MMNWNNAIHPILKFDTEGAEWESIDKTASEDIARFEIITGEFHEFDRLINRAFFDTAIAVLSKLATTHYVVHLHANHAGGFVLLGGMPFPRLLELNG